MESTDFQQEHHHHQQHQGQQQQEHHCSGYYSPDPVHEQQQQTNSYGGVSSTAHHQFLHRPNPSNLITLSNQQAAAGHGGVVDQEEDHPCASSGRLTASMDDSSTFYQSPTIFHEAAALAHQQTANKIRIPADGYNLASPNVLSLSNYLNSINPNDDPAGALSYTNWLSPLGSLGGGGANMEALSVSSARHHEFGSTAHVLHGGSSSNSSLSPLGLLSNCMPPVSNSSLMSSFLGLNSPVGCSTDVFPSSGMGFGDRQQTMSLRSGCSSSNRLNKASSPALERSINNGSSSSSSSSSVTGVKRPATAAGNVNYSKTTTATVKGGTTITNTSSKKSSTASKNSGPPFKVRKEKLGDRIAALHQLVSPFGKTDTASVLTEAIGYIQFLQDQIHTLCMPTVKPPLHNSSRMTHVVSSEHDDARDRGKVITSPPDLRRRGLCLVPVSWTSFLELDQLDAINNNHLHHHHFF